MSGKLERSERTSGKSWDLCNPRNEYYIQPRHRGIRPSRRLHALRHSWQRLDEVGCRRLAIRVGANVADRRRRHIVGSLRSLALAMSTVSKDRQLKLTG